MSVLDLIETGSLNYQIAAYLSLVMGEGMSMFVSGLERLCGAPRTATPP